MRPIYIGCIMLPLETTYLGLAFHYLHAFVWDKLGKPEKEGVEGEFVSALLLTRESVQDFDCCFAE